MTNNKENRLKLAKFLVSKTSLQRLEEFFEESVTDSMEDDTELFNIYLDKCKNLGLKEKDLVPEVDTTCVQLEESDGL